MKYLQDIQRDLSHLITRCIGVRRNGESPHGRLKRVLPVGDSEPCGHPGKEDFQIGWSDRDTECLQGSKPFADRLNHHQYICTSTSKPYTIAIHRSESRGDARDKDSVRLEPSLHIVTDGNRELSLFECSGYLLNAWCDATIHFTKRSELLANEHITNDLSLPCSASTRKTQHDALRFQLLKSLYTKGIIKHK